MIIEKNYKNEINELIKKINNTNNSNNSKNHLLYLQNLKSLIENFINSFDNINNPDNITLQEKRHYYLTLLFNVYSMLLNLGFLLSIEEKEDIISKVLKYLNFFELKGTGYCSSLVTIFYNNDNEIFGEFCVQILGFYSKRGTEYFSINEKKYANHYFEEALSINKK